MINYLRLLLFSLPLAAALSISSAAASPDADSRGSGGTNATADRHPYLILVSIDGFRWDYLNQHAGPALERLVANGLRAESMRPVFPTLTFPNHYTIATGLYPVEHGIVANDFPDDSRQHWYSYKVPDTVQDGAWYGGEPIWVAAERAGLVSAAFYFVGTEAPVDGIAPSHWRAFDATVPGDDRVDQALEWLRLPDAARPHLITLYFEQVDDVSHRFGPGSPESIAAINTVDGWLQRLLDGLDRLPFRDEVYVVVVSDHGQSTYRADTEPLVLADIIELKHLTVSESGPFTLLYLESGGEERAVAIRDTVNAQWQNGRAYRPGDAPAAWRLTESPRVADVILQADPGFGVVSTRDKLRFITPGDHGWAPEVRDMHGVFVASGPGIAAGTEVGIIDAVETYPLLLDMLGLPDRRTLRHASRLANLLESTAALPADAAPDTVTTENDR